MCSVKTSKPVTWWWVGKVKVTATTDTLARKSSGFRETGTSVERYRMYTILDVRYKSTDDCVWATYDWLLGFTPHTELGLLDQVNQVSPASPCVAVRHLAFVRQSLALPFCGWPRAQGLRVKTWYLPRPLEASALFHSTQKQARKLTLNVYFYILLTIHFLDD